MPVTLKVAVLPLQIGPLLLEIEAVGKGLTVTVELPLKVLVQTGVPVVATLTRVRVWLAVAFGTEIVWELPVKLMVWFAPPLRL